MMFKVSSAAPPRPRCVRPVAPREVDGKHAENRPDARRAARPGQAIDPVCDRDRSREQMGKLSNDRAGVEDR